MEEEEPVLKIRLLVDKEENKVVLAEVDKDFVDVLFSFLALPMGTIVRLLETYQQNQESEAMTIGCFNKLYESVCNMDTDDFMTEACKHTLLYTRSVKDRQCRQLKINIDDNEVLKYYRCSNVGPYSSAYYHSYSNFCSYTCSCGSSINMEFDENEEFDENVKFHEHVENYDIFSSNKNSFIVTDDMEVVPSSFSLILKTIRGLGYDPDGDKLHEIIIDANHEKVLALLYCLFSSDTPLTDAFLRNSSSYVMTKTFNMSSLVMRDDEGKEKSNEGLFVTVYIRKHDSKILYVESEQDFVDLLFTFLALPLESVWELCGSNFVFGCIGNFCKNIKTLSGESDPDTYTCMIHYHYSIPKPLFDVSYTDDCGETTLSKYFMDHYLKPMHPNGYLVSSIPISSKGFVKGRSYMISDDLTFTPITPSSTLCIMKKLEIDWDDIEEHVISINKAEAVRLLIASLMTSTVLTTALGCLIPKKLNKEKPLHSMLHGDAKHTSSPVPITSPGLGGDGVETSRKRFRKKGDLSALGSLVPKKLKE